MAIIETIATGAVSAAGGGLTGIIGSALGRVFGYFERKQQFAFEQKRWENDRQVELHELALIDKNMMAQSQENEQLIELEFAKASRLGMAASYKHDTGTGKASQRVVDGLRMVRPILTVMLIILLGLIYFTIADAALQAKVVGAVVYTTVTAVVWWYGDRAPKSVRMDMGGK